MEFNPFDNLETRKRVIGKHNVASDRGRQCLLTGFPSEIEEERQNKPDTPKMVNGLVQHIIVEESTSIQWVKVVVNLI